ncbi:MAG: aminopeptidase [Eubacteriales bacterium]
MIEERYELAKERLVELVSEETVEQPYGAYFYKVSTFLNDLMQWYEEKWYQDKGIGQIDASFLEKEELCRLQMDLEKMYEDILPKSYETSYANPAYAVKELGDELGGTLAALYTEMRSIIASCHEGDLEDVVIHLELFLEVYCLFCQSYEELQQPPKKEVVVEIFSWFVKDYCETQLEKRVKEQLDPTNQFAVRYIKKCDLSDMRYLYGFGEYITQYEVQLAEFLNTLSEEVIENMANTFTNGFQMGFIVGKKDLSKKEVVNIRYVIGFERVVRKAIENFEQMGLQVTIYRAGNNWFHRRGIAKIGYYGAVANRQYEYDHKEDDALFLDKSLCNRRLEVLKQAYEQCKNWAIVHAGPACMEVFGEGPFNPMNKEEALQYSKEQQQLMVEYQGKSGQLVNEYINPEERSFTIIAFPTPQIGNQFSEIFQETIRINTLDYQEYESMQQTLIDTLDQGEYVRIRGMNGNHTDLVVHLWELTDPNTQTKFENCVADVNIPVGEVFTSPKLKGTQGTLHVTKVYLNGLEYRNLTLLFQDGMVTEYNCSNYDQEEKNHKYVKETVMSHRDTLPMGEFAIGTNTTAYAVAKKYGLEDQFPILIAEKMGPHFAIGDTCYSHSEEIAVCNQDGKEVIARENECSALRKESEEEAYFYHHLDITIPYDELEEIVVIRNDNSEIPIIQKGKFVLKGLELLNKPLIS